MIKEKNERKKMEKDNGYVVYNVKIWHKMEERVVCSAHAV